jgi:hypothetical protein
VLGNSVLIAPSNVSLSPQLHDVLFQSWIKPAPMCDDDMSSACKMMHD